MGENNEILNFLKAMGIDLKRTTVVGQVLNAPLDVIKFQVAVAQAFQGVGDLSKNLSRDVHRAEGDLERELKKGVQNVGRQGGRIANQARKDVENGVRWLGDRTGIRLPW